MTIEINQSDLLKELSYWHHKTDDECIALATSKAIVLLPTSGGP